MSIQNRLKIFLCHASEDKNKVYELYERLSNEGHELWLDRVSLLPGQDWRQEIEKAVQSSDVVVVCLTKNSINKDGFIQKEISFALDTAEKKPEGVIFIIPVRLETCEIPYRLKQWQYVDFYESGGYKKILNSLSERTKKLTRLDQKTVLNKFNQERILASMKTMKAESRVKSFIEAIKWGRMLLKFQNENDLEIKEEIEHIFTELLRLRLMKKIFNESTIEDELIVANEMIEIFPEKTIYWTHRAQIRKRKEDNEGALYDYSKAIEINPNDYELWKTRSAFFEKIGETSLALGDLSKAINIAPNDFIVWENRFNFYERMGRNDLALSDLSKAIEILLSEPDDDTTDYHIIRLLEKRMNIFQANNDYKLLLKDYDSFTQIFMKGKKDEIDLIRTAEMLLEKLEIRITKSNEDLDFEEIKKDVTTLANILNILDHDKKTPNPNNLLHFMDRNELIKVFTVYLQELSDFFQDKRIISLQEKAGVEVLKNADGTISIKKPKA